MTWQLSVTGPSHQQLLCGLLVFVYTFGWDTMLSAFFPEDRVGVSSQTMNADLRPGMKSVQVISSMCCDFIVMVGHQQSYPSEFGLRRARFLDKQQSNAWQKGQKSQWERRHLGTLLQSNFSPGRRTYHKVIQAQALSGGIYLSQVLLLCVRNVLFVWTTAHPPSLAHVYSLSSLQLV